MTDLAPRSERDATLVLVKRRSALAIVTLNRPERLNAMGSAMMEQLRQTIDDVLDDDTVRAVLLTGAGRGFCAGLDMKDAQPAAAGDLLRNLLNPMVLKMIRAPKPIVCAVNGAAAGAGCALALACDIILAGRSATFSQAFVRIGAVPDAGSSWLLPRLIGLSRARSMMLVGGAVSAAQAENWGLVHQVFDDDRLSAEAIALATMFAAGPTRAYAGIKDLLDRATANTLDDQLDFEAQLQDQMCGTTDRDEGIRAFLERRAARFTGQ